MGREINEKKELATTIARNDKLVVSHFSMKCSTAVVGAVLETRI